MAYNEGLAQRVRVVLEGKSGLVEKKMFGGVCFLLRGNMACGILNESLIVRIGLEKYEKALKQPHTSKFDITGKPMKGWVMVSSEGHNTDERLSYWIEQGVAFALTLPEK
jgi:TfoX/Sxy family transcriptional regulator of competence genes